MKAQCRLLTEAVWKRSFVIADGGCCFARASDKAHGQVGVVR